MKNIQILMQTNPMQAASSVVMSRSVSHFAWLPVVAVDGFAADGFAVAGACAAEGVNAVNAYAANRLGNGRIAASAHAWDTNGGVPEFQANVCTAAVKSDLKSEVKTELKTTVKTIKRPLSRCGPPND